jgi:hypothetical protein
MHRGEGMKILFSILAALPMLGWSCTTIDIGGADCWTSADCAYGYVCGFPESAGCSAQGLCFMAPGAVCEAYAPGCACDGTEITIVCTGLPNGYVSKALLHEGACTGGACGNTNLPCRSTDGGACCPQGWLLYGCTFPDGGAGLACHDPALGCASSLTCGEGCDQVVAGRCGS